LYIILINNNILKITTKAIVIQHFPFRDGQTICHFYTRDIGMVPCVVRGLGGKSKRQILLHHLALLELQIERRPNNELYTLKEARRAYFYNNIPGDVAKSALGIFLAEVIFKTLKEPEAHIQLFDFLWNAAQMIDLESQVANLHLFVMMGMIKHLGFNPNPLENNRYKQPVFDLQSGRWQEESLGHDDVLNTDLGRIFVRISGMKFDELKALKMSSTERRILLRAAIDYLQLHLSGKKEINSLTILETVFDE
jgi:DNA repair protein RecO (recombination protein O)